MREARAEAAYPSLVDTARSEGARMGVVGVQTALSVQAAAGAEWIHR